MGLVGQVVLEKSGENDCQTPWISHTQQSRVNIELAGSCGMLWHAAECYGMLRNANDVYVLVS